ncbi:unnamed protein product, partial [Ixodes persulcatus]
MLKASECLVGLAIDQIEQAAFNRGKVEGLSELILHLTSENADLKKQLEEAKTNTKGELSYAEILRTTAPTSDTNPEGETNPNKGPTNTVGQPHNNTETNPETTEGLIIRPSDPSIEVPFQHVKQILNRCFTPHEIG